MRWVADTNSNADTNSDWDANSDANSDADTNSDADPGAKCSEQLGGDGSFHKSNQPGVDGQLKQRGRL